MSSARSNMSWLGSGLSQITGQISSFTKEVLTEGTEEVDDHATELRVAKSRLVEVEGHFFAAKTELDRVKKLNEELNEKLHASELHTNAIAAEYRDKVEEREREIQQLKQQHHAVLETQSKLAVASASPISHLTTTSSAPHLHAFGGDEHDFDDVISGQTEINRLQLEVERLSAECRHWRQVANLQQKSPGEHQFAGQSQVTDENIAELHSRIKELERQLSSEIDDHQNELAALQNLHAGKLAAQSRKLSDEKDKLQAKIDTLEDHILQMESAGDNVNLVDELKELKEANDQLSLENEAANKRVAELLQQQKDALHNQSLIEGDANSAWKPELVSSTPLRAGRHQAAPQDTLELSFSELSETNKHLNDELVALRQQVSVYQQEVSQFDLVRSDLVSEKEALESVLIQLRAKLKDKEEQVAVKQAEKGLREVARQQEEVEDEDKYEDEEYEDDVSDEEQVTNNSKPISEMSADELGRQLELLTKGNSMLENERDNLLEEKEELQQKVTELEQQVTKLFAVDAKCLQLQAELDEKTTELESLHQQVAQQDDQLGKFSSNYDESFESIIEKEAEIAELEEKLQALEQENEVLQQERSRRLLDEDVDDEIQRMRDELREKNKEIEYLQEQEKQLKYVTVEMKEREASFRDLEEEKRILENNLDELDSQHQDAIAAVMESKEKINKNNEKLKQRVKEVEAELANLSASQDYGEETAALQEELHRAQAEVHRLQGEKEKREEDMTDINGRLEESAHTLNNLHMDKQELENTIKNMKAQIGDLQNSLSNLSSEKKKLETSHGELQMQLHQTHEKLQAETTKSQINTGLQSDLMRLKEQLNTSQHHAAEHNAHIETLEKEIVSLQDQLTNSKQVKEQLTTQSERMKKNLDDEVESMRQEVNKLATMNKKLEVEVEQSADRLKEQGQRYEDYIQEINRAKELDASSLEQNHRKMMEENHLKDMKISELEVSVAALKNESEELHSKLQSALNDQQDVAALLHDKEAEVAALEAQAQALQEYAEEKASALLTLQTQPKVAASQSENDSEKLNELQTQLTKLEGQLSTKEQQIAVSEVAVNQLKQELSEQTTSFEQERSRLTTDNESLSEKIKTLEASIQKKELELAKAEEELKSATSVSNGHVENGDSEPSSDNTESAKTKPVFDEDDGRSRLLAQKDDVIKELRGNNQSLLKLLEERSFQLHGNQSLVDIHKLQNEVKGLKMEKEQMMAVLNDKTRECSNLKSEVHKLMNVISAEKTALSKLQKDNQELIKNQNSPKKEDPNSDMTKDAIKRMAMVIRDKDLEIESLTQKNQTLLQVMQQNPESGAQMTTILQERENLMKQLELYQKEREQIIVALNQKHQEAVAYHNEIQRLMNLTNENNNKCEKLEENFTSLKQQYEDKQQALLKVQNELLNYKQKFSEVDSKYKEMLHRQAQQVQQQVQSPPPLPTPKSKSALESTEESEEGGELSSATTSTQYEQHISHLNSLIQQKKEEMAQLTEQVHQARMAIQEKDRAIAEAKRTVTVKEQVVKDKEAVITARNQAISEANARVREAHEDMRKKDLDISSLRKQIDNMTFQARGLQTELNDLKLERDNAMDRMEGVVSERTQLAEANARLSAAIGERDLEMNAMREKTATLTAAVREVGAEKGEVEQMLADTEAMQKAAQVLQAERDQAYASLQAVQADNTALKQQSHLVTEREQKLQRELERLRSHLLTIEEGYTQEALAAEEREKELRNRLAAAEENAAHSSNAVQNYSVEATRQVESLQEQLKVIAEQRDNAMLQLSQASDTASQYAASLTNLQMVLEQFQKEREEQQSVEMERYQRDLAARSKQLAEVLETNKTLQARVEETTDALEAAQRLSEQLDKQEEAMAALKEEVLLREEELKKAEMEIQRLTTSSEAKVDKVIIKNLILGYFQTPSNKRHEVLTLLGKVLSFTHPEMEQVGATTSSGGWLRGVFNRTVGSVATPPTTPNKNSSMDKSFSEMFVKFLERESSPQPQMRLPAEAMAREAQQKQQRNKPPAFNPFSVPAASTGPAGQATPSAPTSSTADSHILMKPMAGALPMFSPVTPTATVGLPSTGSVPTNTESIGTKELPPGRLSATSSGRSTPASVILKDVLQQQ